MALNLYKKYVEKRIVALSKGSEPKEKEKLAYFLRLYTHLILAEYSLQKGRGFDALRVVVNLTSNQHYGGEQQYIQYLNYLSKKVLRNQKAIMKALAKEPTTDPHYAKTELRTAQNICVMRILKISRV